MMMNRILSSRVPVSVAVYLALAFSSSAYAEVIKALTYNAGLLTALGADVVPLVRPRAAKIPPELAKFVKEESVQLILFQEIWDDAHSEMLQKELSPLGFRFVRPTECNDLTKMGSGLLLAYAGTYQLIREPKLHVFEMLAGVSRFTKKGVLSVELRHAEDGPVVVLGTHMDALDTRDGEAQDKTQAGAHRAQSGQILKVMEEWSESGKKPVILLGDFNVGPGYVDSHYRRFTSVPGMIEIYEALHAGAPDFTWDRENPLVRYGKYPHEPSAKVDHVFVKEGAEMEWKAKSAKIVFRDSVEGLEYRPANGSVVNTPLSDHYGLLVEVERIRKL